MGMPPNQMNPELMRRMQQARMQGVQPGGMQPQPAQPPQMPPGGPQMGQQQPPMPPMGQPPQMMQPPPQGLPAPPQPPQPEPSPDIEIPDPPRWEWLDDHEMLLNKFSEWDKELEAHWSEWREEAVTAYEVTAGRQWDKGAEEASALLGLTTVSINKIDSTVSAICGSEMTNRQTVRYYPRETAVRGPDGSMQDVAVNELLTSAAEWVRDECEAQDEESEAFRDCVICGLGVIESRMDYDNDIQGRAVVERVDPMEISIDATARRPNAVDASYLRRKRAFSKDEAKRRFGTDGDSDAAPTSSGEVHDNHPNSAYQGRGADQFMGRNDVWVTEFQWRELEVVYLVPNQNMGQVEVLEEMEFQRLAEQAPELYELATKATVARFYRAVRAGNKIVMSGPLDCGEFTYKFLTGKLDRNRGVWYGVVRAMVDPQRLLNKQISQIQRIVDTNAKGGLLSEVDAFEDPVQAEEDWAASDTIVWTKAGAVSGGKVVPKPMSQLSTGFDRLLAIANEAVPGVSGVNNEMLGIIDREQAGVVDVTRKEAAYGVLKAFFSSLGRYRRMHGRHLLKMIQKYMSDGRLVRISGRTGSIQYLPLVREMTTGRYDVIVDEAPTGPNQKERVFQFLGQMMPLLRSMSLPPSVLLKFMEYAPIPTSLVAEIQQIAKEEAQKAAQQPNPAMLKAQAEAQQAQTEAQQAQVMLQKIQMDGQAAQVKAQSDQMKAQSEQARLQLDLQKSQLEQQKLQIENQWAKLEMEKVQTQQIADQHEAELRARETAMRERNDTAKIEADAQKAQADIELQRLELENRRAEIELQREQLDLKRYEIDQKIMIEREGLGHAEKMHNAKVTNTRFAGEGETPGERQMRELHELMSAPVEIEIDAVTGKKRARRVVTPKVKTETKTSAASEENK